MKLELNQRAIDQLAKEATRSAAKDFQRRLDALAPRCKGQPVEMVRRLLRDDIEANGGHITDPELSDWAKLLAEGARIKVRA